jgi:uncharacterized membrane protein SpoIIM required for sporulation
VHNAILWFLASIALGLWVMHLIASNGLWQ